MNTIENLFNKTCTFQDFYSNMQPFTGSISKHTRYVVNLIKVAREHADRGQVVERRFRNNAYQHCFTHWLQQLSAHDSNTTPDASLKLKALHIEKVIRTIYDTEDDSAFYDKARYILNSEMDKLRDNIVEGFKNIIDDSTSKINTAQLIDNYIEMLYVMPKQMWREYPGFFIDMKFPLSRVFGGFVLDYHYDTFQMDRSHDCYAENTKFLTFLLALANQPTTLPSCEEIALLLGCYADYVVSYEEEPEIKKMSQYFVLFVQDLSVRRYSFTKTQKATLLKLCFKSLVNTEWQAAYDQQLFMCLLYQDPTELRVMLRDYVGGATDSNGSYNIKAHRIASNYCMMRNFAGNTNVLVGKQDDTISMENILILNQLALECAFTVQKQMAGIIESYFVERTIEVNTVVLSLRTEGQKTLMEKDVENRVTMQYTDLIPVLWFNKNIISVSQVHDLERQETLQISHKLLKDIINAPNLNAWLSLSDNGSDNLYHIFLAYLNTSAYALHRFTCLLHPTLTFACKRLLTPIVVIMMHDRIRRPLGFAADYDDQYNSVCDQLVAANLSLEPCILALEFYNVIDGRKVPQEGRDIGGLTRTFLQHVVDNVIPTLPFLKITSCGKYYFDDAGITNKAEVIKFAHFLALLIAQKEKVRFRLKEEIIYSITGGRLLPFCEYYVCFDDATRNGLSLIVGDDDEKSELHELALENSFRQFIDKGSRTTAIINEVFQELFDRAPALMLYEHVRVALYDCKMLTTHESVKKVTKLIVPGLESEDRSEENKIQLKAAADAKYQSLHAALDNFDQERLMAFVKICCGSVYGARRIIVSYSDCDVLPSWSTCIRTMYIGRGFTQAQLEFAMDHVEGFQLV